MVKHIIVTNTDRKSKLLMNKDKIWMENDNPGFSKLTDKMIRPRFSNKASRTFKKHTNKTKL